MKRFYSNRFRSAEKTQRTLKLRNFSEYFHRESMPVSAETCLYMYIQLCRAYCKELLELSLLNNAEFPSLHDFQIKLTLRGLGKVLFHTQRQAASSYSDILTDIWREVAFSNPMLSTVWCTCVLAFL